MTERYSLSSTTFPTIPNPHDSLVTQIKVDETCISFYFENDLSHHDSIKAIHPGAQSLVIRYHLTRYREFAFYQWHRRIRPFLPQGFFVPIPSDRAVKLALSQKFSYLRHYVDYQSIIVQLDSLVRAAEVESVELEWIESQDRLP